MVPVIDGVESRELYPRPTSSTAWHDQDYTQFDLETADQQIVIEHVFASVLGQQAWELAARHREQEMGGVRPLPHHE
eukprot:1309800-Pyramimonas_sp.AAC.1